MILMQQMYAKSKALDVLESDVDYHFTGLRLRQPVIDPTSMKRLHRAQLPVQESERVTDMLGKVAAIAKSRQEMKQKCSEMHVALERTQEEARIAEFAREKAEALATARGHALMKCQDALAEAEEQQVQLGGLLRSALEQLGVHSPEKRMSIENRLYATPGTLGRPISYQKTPHTVKSVPRMENIECRRHADITPPASSGALVGAQVTPPSTAGWTVYSNALSQDISPKMYMSGDYATPIHGEGALDHQRTCEIGPQTAERLARMVLPHLDSNQIQSLVDCGTETPNDRKNSVVQDHKVEMVDVQQKIHKTSTFSAAAFSQQNGKDDVLIKAHNGEQEPIDSVERKRQAAERVMRKLNEKLPPELQRQGNDWLLS